MAPEPAIRIGIVAGEVSGDMLGAGLMRALKRRLPEARFEGIGGPQMQAQGCRSLFSMDLLSHIGFEALGKFPSILRVRRDLVRHFLAHPPDLYIGIDVPDFNLGLEERLKAAGIPTIHYVSPTVWAWRRYRLRRIHRAVDLMLTLFPFEEQYYREHSVPVTFVGHPLADQISDRGDMAAARRTLGLGLDRTIVALLPGSRVNELRRHADLFVRTAQWLHRRHPAMQFVAPFASPATQFLFERALQKRGAGDVPIVFAPGRSRDAMAASDVVLMASGTATLEAALLKKVMVVTYKVSWFSYALIRLFAHVKMYSLPNHLAGRPLVPEFMQGRARPERLGAAVEHYLSYPADAAAVKDALGTIRRTLACDADHVAAEAVLGLLRARPQRQGSSGNASATPAPR